MDTGGVDGRLGHATAVAMRDYQHKARVEPADGYARAGLLARLRKGS